jgi:GH35 family endo-1,4-beta-xylanase
MRKYMASLIVSAASCFGLTTSAWAQTSITGSNLVFKSLGTQSTTLSATGYLGTYIVVPAGGATVNFDVNATGAAGHLDVVVANSSFGFNVTGGTATDYTTQNVALPAGTYFVRAERDYDNGLNQSFSVNNLSVNTVAGSGGAVQFSNLSPNGSTSAAAAANAMNTATTYINNYREGALNLSVPGVAPGTPIEVKEINSAFKWGTAVPDTLSTYLAPGPATTYQTLLKKDFNSITPENGGKWAESSTASQLTNLDTMLNFASANNIRVRMHNLIWGSQQPTAVNTDFTNARSTNPTTAAAGKAAITAAVTNRINNYVGGTNSLTGGSTGLPATIRASQYAELDVYNESYHTGSAASASTGDNYWQVMGGGTAAGGAAYTASVYNQVQSTVTAAGANTKLFTNDYNVLNNNSDQYGQWYQQHVESIRTAGGAVTGIGTEDYNTPGVGMSGSQVDPSRSFTTWQNLSAQGLPLEVTEFGETAVAGADEATALTTAMTLAFGTQQMTGFTLWGFYNYGSGMYSGSVGSVLYDQNFNITAAGTAYEALMKSWTTDDTTTVNADGSVTLPSEAFYGDYEAIINGKDYDFTYDPSTNNYVIAIPEPATSLAVLLGFLLLLTHRSKRSPAYVVVRTQP